MLRHRRHAYPRRAYRKDLKRFLIKNRRRLSVVAAGYAILMAAMALLADGYFLGLVHGAFTALALAMVGLVHLAATGSLAQLAGAWGEDNTRDLLRWAKRRRLIYGWVDSLEIQGGDVDHLVAAPSGWIAIDSKWHSQSLDRSVVVRDAERATRAARRASLILRSLTRRADARPVVFVWGGTRDELSDLDRMVAGVEFVSGSDLKEWFRRLPTGGTDRRSAIAALRDLRSFRSRVRVSDAPIRDYRSLKRSRYWRSVTGAR
jgi:hypothetical protein